MLFAALDVKSGAVINDCKLRPRAKEFLKFLRQTDGLCPRSAMYIWCWTTIYDVLAQNNKKPQPYRWTKNAKSILALECRALNALNEIRQIR